MHDVIHYKLKMQRIKNNLVSILVVFSVGHFVRGVDMSLGNWIGAALLLIVGSIAFVALGLTLTLLPSSQLMSVVGNLLYFGLAVLGGLWMPVSLFPDWMQAIGKRLPSYQLMELLKTFLNEGGINLSATVYLLVFSAVLFGAGYFRIPVPQANSSNFFLSLVFGK